MKKIFENYEKCVVTQKKLKFCKYLNLDEHMKIV